MMASDGRADFCLAAARCILAENEGNRAMLRIRLRQSLPLLERALRHPDWFLENLRLARVRQRAGQRPFAAACYRRYLVSQQDAVLAALGCTAGQFEAARAAVRQPSYALDGVPEGWNASPELMTTVGAIVRLLKPDVMVETGVARGISSAVALAAMAENGRGHLYSIDFPALLVDPQRFVGQAVPPALRGRWTLLSGPSRLLLPGLVRRVAPLDLFLHDADHTYQSQLTEYRTVWPHLRSGGLLLSDDIINPAFVHFARRVGAGPFLVAQPGNGSPLGIMRKP